MEYVALGRSSLRIPKIGFGSWRYRGGTGVLRRAVELGAGFVDTAESYGTEPAVGDDIKEFRDRVFVATKVSPENLRHGDVLSHAEASLRRLRTSYVDLYQVHWPNPDIPISETMAAMEELVSAGKVLHVGVSNFSVAQMKEAQNALKNNRLMSNQVPYNLYSRQIEEDILPYCQEQGIAVIAWSPLARGRFESAALGRVASETGKTRAQIMLNWCVSHAGVMAIPKTDRPERVDEAVGAVGWELSPEQRAALEAGA